MNAFSVTHRACVQRQQSVSSVARSRLTARRRSQAAWLRNTCGLSGSDQPSIQGAGRATRSQPPSRTNRPALGRLLANTPSPSMFRRLHRPLHQTAPPYGQRKSCIRSDWNRLVTYTFPPRPVAILAIDHEDVSRAVDRDVVRLVELSVVRTGSTPLVAGRRRPRRTSGCDRSRCRRLRPYFVPFPHRARAPCFAIAARLAFDSFAARALPPLSPPRRPSSTAIAERCSRSAIVLARRLRRAFRPSSPEWPRFGMRRYSPARLERSSTP